jgi:hypothetical protein
VTALRMIPSLFALAICGVVLLFVSFGGGL